MFNEYEPFLTDAVKTAIIEHMDRDAPKEACGFIMRDKHGGYYYSALKNTHETPLTHFSIGQKYSKQAMTDDNVIAIAHSHPNGPVIPSKEDMLSQAALDKPFVIAVRNPATGSCGVFSFGDHLLSCPLIGRPWHYGRFDCYEAVRSWVFQNQGHTLPKMPRTDWWWEGSRQHEVAEEDFDMYARNIEHGGYAEFKPDISNPASRWHPVPGDMVFMRISSPVINHLGVYVGQNLVFHHRYGKPSGHNPLGYFTDAHYVSKWARRKELMA